MLGPSVESQGCSGSSRGCHGSVPRLGLKEYHIKIALKEPIVSLLFVAASDPDEGLAFYYMQVSRFRQIIIFVNRTGLFLANKKYCRSTF